MSHAKALKDKDGRRENKEWRRERKGKGRKGDWR